MNHASVNRPCNGGVERGMSAASAMFPCPSMGRKEWSLRSWRFGKSPMKYKICRHEPVGPLRARDRSVGEKRPKHCWMVGMKLDTWR